MLGAFLNIKVRDRETVPPAILVKDLEYSAGDAVDACESIFPEFPGVDFPVGAPHLARRQICPANQPHRIIEEKIPLRLTVADKDVGKSVRTGLGYEPAHIQIRKYVNIMDQERAALKQRPGELYPAAGLP